MSIDRADLSPPRHRPPKRIDDAPSRNTARIGYLPSPNSGGDVEARIVPDGRRAEHAFRPGGIPLGGGAKRTEFGERRGDERIDGTTLPIDGDDLVRHRNLSKSARI